MQQIANLSSRLGCIGSSPILSAIKENTLTGVFFMEKGDIGLEPKGALSKKAQGCAFLSASSLQHLGKQGLQSNRREPRCQRERAACGVVLLPEFTSI